MLPRCLSTRVEMPRLPANSHSQRIKKKILNGDVTPIFTNPIYKEEKKIKNLQFSPNPCAMSGLADVTSVLLRDSTGGETTTMNGVNLQDIKTCTVYETGIRFSSCLLK